MQRADSEATGGAASASLPCSSAAAAGELLPSGAARLLAVLRLPLVLALPLNSSSLPLSEPLSSAYSGPTPGPHGWCSVRATGREGVDQEGLQEAEEHSNTLAHSNTPANARGKILQYAPPPT